MSPIVVHHTEQVLREILRFIGPADVTLSRYFRENPKLGQRERGLIAEAIYSILRNKMTYTNFAESGVGPGMRRMALLGLADVSSIDAIAGLSEEERAWLERIAHIDRKALIPQLRANMPKWLFDKLIDRHGEETAFQLIDALNQPAPLDLRVNTAKAARESALEALATAGIKAEPTPYSPLGIRLASKPALQKLPLFQEGGVEVQDEGSQLLTQLVAARRGEMVVDFCAGAGGKTLALGAAMRNTGRLYAFDVSDKRLSKLKPRLARSGLSNVHPTLIAHENDAKVKRLAGKIDRVLVDAPCTGLGTLRRNPDVKWRQTPQTVEEMNVKQAAILSGAARLVKPGGRLVYATCSILEEENEAIVEQFLATNPDFVLLPAGQILEEQKVPLMMQDYLKLNPHEHHTDGFFAAIMERKK